MRAEEVVVVVVEAAMVEAVEAACSLEEPRVVDGDAADGGSEDCLEEAAAGLESSERWRLAAGDAAVAAAVRLARGKEVRVGSLDFARRTCATPSLPRRVTA